MLPQDLLLLSLFLFSSQDSPQTFLDSILLGLHMPLDYFRRELVGLRIVDHDTPRTFLDHSRILTLPPLYMHRDAFVFAMKDYTQCLGVDAYRLNLPLHL